MAYDKNAALLQSQINRFASVAGFAVLSVDGDVGQRTLSALNKALFYVGYKTSKVNTVTQNQALAFQDASTQAIATKANVMSIAPTLSSILSTAANEIGLANVAAPAPSPPPGVAPVQPEYGYQLRPPPGAGTATSIRERFANVPTWALYGGGAAAILIGYLLLTDKKAK
jgi:lysozyme family protein